MDPVTLVVSALAAGATAGLKDTAATGLKDAYSALKEALKRRFEGRPDAEMTLREYEVDQDTWHAPLANFVQEVGVDEQIVVLAQRVLQAVRTESPTYNIITDSVQGVQREITTTRPTCGVLEASTERLGRRGTQRDSPRAGLHRRLL